MSNTNELFLTLAMFKGQLDDIHHSIEQDILNKIKVDKEDKEAKQYPYNKPKSVMVQLHVTNTNAQGSGQNLVVEELSRLRSFVVSLEETIAYINVIAGMPQIGNTDPKG
jgi:hypothetical protein